ncbi:MAG: transposase family protein [Phormidesmis sp. RL_2_1]|nr:transposase family protein [Phormidesmis sp. RL_2_1]
MDIHLDTLLNFPDVTVESCTQEVGNVFLKLHFLKDSSVCPHCNQLSDNLHQTRSTLLRDLSIFGQATYLKVPRRQFYCQQCKTHFTEVLSFMESGRQYTRRYEEYIYQQVQLSTIQQVSRVEELTFDRVEGIFNHQYQLKKKTRGAASNGSGLTKSVNGKDISSLPPLSATLKLGNSLK